MWVTQETTELVGLNADSRRPCDRRWVICVIDCLECMLPHPLLRHTRLEIIEGEGHRRVGATGGDA